MQQQFESSKAGTPYILTFVNWHVEICLLPILVMLGLLLQKHCPLCGIDVDKNTAIKRFGKYFCSDEHASQYTEMKMAKDKERGEGHKGGGCC